MTFRPGTNDLYIGDVGNSTWEEINRYGLPSGARTTTTLPNYGWPCYEGAPQQAALHQPCTPRCAQTWSTGGAGPRRCTRTTTAARSPPGNCPQGSGGVIDHGARVLRGRHRQHRRLPGQVRRRAVLRRLLAQVHRGAPAGCGRRARPVDRRGHRHRRRPGRQRQHRRTRSTSSPGRAATSTTSTWATARSCGCRYLESPTARATADPAQSNGSDPDRARRVDVDRAERRLQHHQLAVGPRPQRHVRRIGRDLRLDAAGPRPATR